MRTFVIVAATLGLAAACDTAKASECLTALSVPTGDYCPYLDSYLGCLGASTCCDDPSLKVAADMIETTGKAQGCTATCTNAAAPCFGRDTMVDLADGSSILMTRLSAGDLVKDGPNSASRVLVNQHREADELKSTLLKIDHTQGSITLTPDHVLNIDGAFGAARGVQPGSKLGESKVSKVTTTNGGIINPLTVSGKIMADGVLASTYPEWIAEYMLTSYLFPTFTLTNLASFAFPAATQTYYDACLERFFQATSPSLMSLKAALPSPLMALFIICADFVAVTGFVVYSLASVNTLVALVVVGAALKARKMK